MPMTFLAVTLTFAGCARALLILMALYVAWLALREIVSALAVYRAKRRILEVLAFAVTQDYPSPDPALVGRLTVEDFARSIGRGRYAEHSEAYGEIAMSAARRLQAEGRIVSSHAGKFYIEHEDLPERFRLSDDERARRGLPDPSATQTAAP